MSTLADVKWVVDPVHEILEGRWQLEFQNHFQYVMQCFTDALRNERSWRDWQWEELRAPGRDIALLMEFELGPRSEAIFWELKRFLDMSVYSKELGQFQEYVRSPC